MSDDPLAGERESADPLAEPHRENPETPSAETAPASDGEAREPAQPDGEASLAAQGELADDVPILVVGVGASAGGLEAFNELLHNLPADTGMAFVCVQHLDPRYRSNLAEILKRATPMAVTEIADGTRLEPNHVYVMPANSDLAMLHRVLRVMPRTDPAGSHMPIDGFFRSLAEDRGSRAIGVVLSGAGSDGALGLRAIQAAGGITFAQDPSTAKHAGMPSSAAAMGVDFVLPAAGIAQELVRIAHAPLVRSLVKGRAVLLPLPQDDLQRLFILLRRGTGVDFSLYKRTTVERRIARRLVLHRLESLSQYVRYLQQNAGEMNALFEDMLINVTCFFRDPESFEALKQSIFPRMLQDKPRDVPIRIWVPGCSTGEEAYSLAIVLLEYLSEQEQHWPIQVFATDVSNEAVQKARDARYPENIAADVSPERLQRYFLREDGGYQISKTVRDMCVVAKQNVIKDPPFSNLDLISCRNLLIYMGPALQKRIIPTFHYALRPGGHLLLGSAETSGGFADLFVLADKKHKFYARKPVPARLPPEFGPIAIDTPAAAPKESSAATSAPPGPVDAEREIDRLLLSRFPVHGVVVDANLNIVHVRGQTGRFLELAPGRTSWNLMKMTREGLALDVRTAIHKAKVDRAPIRKEGLRIQHNGGQLLVNLEILPFRPGEGDEFQYLVLFEEGKPAAALAPPVPEPLSRGAGEGEINRQLEEALNELSETKETLRMIIEQYEATNEELRAANEEIQSSNEELQSTNEELETAKEELQSTNEELTTLNEELESRNTELNQTINDYNNLLASVDMPIVVLDNRRRIRMFTPVAAELLNLIPADRGRPIRELSLGAQIPDLDHRVGEVIEKPHSQDEEFQVAPGRWCSLRLRPYKTSDNRIEGVVLALADLNERHRAEDAERRAEQFGEALLAMLRQPAVILNAAWNVMLANSALLGLIQALPTQVQGRSLFELAGRRWDIPALRTLLEQELPAQGEIRDCVVSYASPSLGRRRVIVSARRLTLPVHDTAVVLTLEDVPHDSGI